MDKSVEKKLIAWLKQQKSACGCYLRLAILLGVINGLLLIAQAYFIATLLDGVIIKGLTIVQLNTEFIGVIVTILSRAMLVYGRERVSFYAGLKLRQHIREQVLTKLTTLGPAFIKGKPSGAWASIVLEQVENLQDYYSKYLPQMTQAVFIPLIILLVVFPLNWAAGLILLMTAPLIPLFMILVGWGAADANRKNFSALAKLSGHFMDRLKGLQTIQLFYQGRNELNHIRQTSEDFRSRTMSVLRLAFLNSAVLEFFAAVSIAVLAVYFGFSYLDHLDFGHYGIAISLFTGLFVLIMAPEFYQPLRDLGTHYHAKAQAIGAAEALMVLLEAPELTSNHLETNVDIQDDKQVVGDISIQAHDLEVLSFDGKTLAGPLTFTIAVNEHIAIVGPSGAGKTSLLNVLLGFLPYKGSLTINGIELIQLDKSSLRKKIAWLGQEPQLFHGSIRHNVTLGCSALTDSDIIGLLKQACIDELLTKPQGLDYVIGDNAQGLSVGQAQRLALARALAQKPCLYLLDEPSASLDANSEKLVLAALSFVSKHHTSIMISHRLDLLSKTTAIWVMDKGQIVQQGQFDELAHCAGLFQNMLQQTENVPFELFDGEAK